MSATVDLTSSMLQLSNSNSRSGLHPIVEDKEVNQAVDSSGPLSDSSNSNSLSPTFERSKRWSLGTLYSSKKVKQILSEDFSEDKESFAADNNALQSQERSKFKSLDTATLSDLLSELVHNNRKDPMFANYFLLASDYVVTPSDLIKKTIAFYSESPIDSDESEQYSLKLRVVNTLSKILNLKPKSKLDSECLALVRQFAEILAMGNEIDRDLSSILRRRIDTAVGKEEASPVRSRRRSLNSYSSLRSIKFDIIEDTARDIAEQFTIVCFSKFQAIPLDVLVKKKFEKETDANETPLGRFIGFFNDSSRWICTQIVMSTTEEREQRIAKFIMIMRELYCLNNFNGVMIFYSALNNAAIQKLIDKCLPSLPIEVISSFEEIKKLMDHRMNFKNYREALEAASAPCIPYMALILRDLMHLEELDTIDEDQRINWHKVSHIGKILYKVSGYQSVAYEFEHIPHIQRYFLNFQRGCTILSEQELYEMGKVVISLGSTSDLLTSSSNNEVIDEDEDIASDELLVDADVPNSLVSEGLYELPPWVLKREVGNTSGSIVEFDSIIANQTVLFVFLRHFGCIICRKSAAELMMIKPQLDRLGVKLVAVGTGTWAQAKAFKDEFKFDGEIYVDEARHLYDDFRCQRGWIKGVLNGKTQALNAEARSLGYAQGPIQGDILQLGGAFILKNCHVMYEHIEKYAGDLADPIEILKRLGAGLDACDEVYKRHPQLKPKQKQMRRKIRALEGKLKKVSKRLRSMSDKTPELLKLDTSSSPVLGRRRWSEKRKRSWSGTSLEYETDKEKEELVKKRQKYNQIKEKALILELKLEKCRNKKNRIIEEQEEREKREN